MFIELTDKRGIKKTYNSACIYRFYIHQDPALGTSSIVEFIGSDIDVPWERVKETYEEIKAILMGE